MNRTKKNISILMVLLLIIFQSLTVKAANWKPDEMSLGETVNGSYWADGEGLDGQITLKGNTYDKDSGDGENIFCVEHGKHLPNQFDATVKYIIHVNKDNVTVEVAGSEDKTWNYDEFSEEEKAAIFRMMYILNIGGTSTDQFHKSEYSEKQKAVWENAGSFFNAVGVDVATESGGYTSSWTDDAQSYVDSMSDIVNNSFTRNKNKDDVSVEEYDNGKYMKVGPFNYTFSGDISDLYLTDGDGNRIDALYAKYSGDGLETSDTANGFVESGNDFYMLFETSKQISRLGKLYINTNSSNSIITGSVYVLETSSNNQNLISTMTATTDNKHSDELDLDIDLLVDLEIIKKDVDTGATLSNVKLDIRRQADGKYIKIDENGNVVYVDNKEEATQFFTDENGRVIVRGVTVGNYVATEIENLNKGYERYPNQEFIIPAFGDGTTSRPTVTFYMNNKRKYADLSGYVWKDIQSGKQTLRNDLYNNDSFDNSDEAVNGMVVALKEMQYDSNGNVIHDSEGRLVGTEIARTTTAEIGHYDEINGGEYVFEDVEISKLKDYYVEFEYDGLIYQSVSKNLGANNGSKAVDTSERTILDNKFNSVDSTGENKVTFNNGQNAIYYNETQEHKATVKDSSDCTLHANTKDADYAITYTDEDYKNGLSEIRYVNLGIYEKAQADLSLAQELENVNVGVNGYWHIYKYGTYVDETTGTIPDNSDRWNVGVKFKDVYENTYTRAIYKSDLDYQTENKDKELQVYLTYRIGIRNESPYITKANSIVDYYDNRYQIVAVGTGLDVQNNNTVTGKIDSYSTDKYNDNLNKAIINTNTTVQPGETNYIYVQFKLNREAVLKIINNGETLYNTSEINSYTVYKNNDGETVAVVDQDSVPGNTVIGKIETYEDDTDARAPIKLELAKNARNITGMVFEDSTADGLQTGSERLGDGEYKDGEKKLAGIKVTLHELNNSIENMETTTDENGEFKFSGYIPGQYTITYTWGDKTYQVQNYKGTIYDSNRDQSNMYWYKDNVDTRKTDAIDNYDERRAIDKEVAAITNHTAQEEVDKAYNGEESLIKIISMNSVTPTMEFSVEYETTITDGNDDKVEFIVKNVDFGIVKRPIQQLDMKKRVSAFKVTLANGQVLADATIDENGKLEGTTNHLTYMKPSADSKGYVKLEIDNELIEGATMEATYTIDAINNSEVDYNSEEYYKYGIKKGDIVTLTPEAVVDYLDKKLGYDESKNADWKQITIEELNNLKAQKINDTDYLNSKMILYSEKTAKALKPTEKSNVELNVSKILTSSEDLTFDNDAETTTIKHGNKPSDPPTPPIHYPEVVPAEPIIIVPSTGGNKGYVTPIITVITSLVILGVGTFIIKKKIIDNK